MDNKKIVILEQDIHQQVEPIIINQDMELVDLELKKGPYRWLLRIFIDREGGITLEHCEQISQLVGAVLEVEDPIPGPYTLEISSPGLDRPLRNESDFIRFQGKLAKIKLKEPPKPGQMVLVGRILETVNHQIGFKVGEECYQIPYSNIAEAHLEVEFPSKCK